jgi:hypothetical protein
MEDRRLPARSKAMGAALRAAVISARVGVRRRWAATTLRTLMASCRASASARISRHRRGRARAVIAFDRPGGRTVTPARRRRQRTVSDVTPSVPRPR